MALLLLWMAPLALAQEGSDLIKAFGGFLSRNVAPTNPGGASSDKAADANTEPLVTDNSSAPGDTSSSRSPSAAFTGKRIALVIGNNAYQKVSKLEKAGNVASAMARELTAAAC
ncbi:MAG: caspase family protein [Rhodoferax sp.]|jgi:hypothetical protein|nr:caspase family protein [Rhodoferax sp.]